MKKLQLIVSICLLYSICINSQEIIQSDSINQIDGPYILKVEDKLKKIVTAAGKVEIYELSELPKSISVQSSKGAYTFDVELYPTSRPDWKYSLPDSMLVLSDPHGNLEALTSVLKSHHVIDDDFDWTYGNGHLMVIGDVFDRGDDVIPIFWLLYKLDKQATENGGHVHFLYGNHEDMVLRNNLKYTNQKYKELAKSLDMDYSKLWENSSVLGEWLLTRNTMEIIGDKLFVHAGISPEMLDVNLSIPEINHLVSSYMGISKEERKNNEVADFLLSNSGILWYRGMVKTDEKYNPLTSKQVDEILKYYGIEQIFVGHTIFDNVSALFEDKVITINVNNQKNMDNNASRGVLIKNGIEYIIFDDSTKTTLLVPPL